LRRVLSSEAFGAAESQKAFLRYTVEQTLAGYGGRIKEYSIATEVFGKGSAFDSRLDPIVRIQAGNVRSRLSKYYETAGLEDSIRIELPKGSYSPRFHNQNHEAPPEAPKPPRFETEVEPAVASPSRVHASFHRGALLKLAIAIVLAMAAVAAWFIFRGRGTEGVPARTSVVVIPFRNLSDNREDEFFSDGLTDELIDSLAQIPNLRVIGRTSAFTYRGKAIDLREIGESLGVDAVLQGSVRRFGRRLRITAQLTDSKEAAILWSDSYDREIVDVLAIQKEIARAITVAFKIKGNFPTPPPQVAGTFTAPAAPSGKVQEDYLKARYFWAKNTPESVATAIGYLQEGIRLAPDWAPNYSGLAQCYLALPPLTGARAKDFVPKIRGAALKALELDPAAGIAHIALAVAAMYEFDWTTAEKEFQRGLAVASSASPHQSYSNFLLLTGRPTEAVHQDEIALGLDPISPFMAQALAKSLRYAGRLDESIAQSQKALALDPNYGVTRENLGAAYLQKEMYPEAIRELERARDLLGPGPGPVSHLAYAYARAGRTAEAKQLLDASLRQYEQGSMSAIAIARIYLGLRDQERALDWLEKAVDRQDVNILIQSDPVYESLRQDPRFQALLKRMHLKN
jgi:TolB-like protein/tetratricopeptide (TPR) repeat protein